MISSNSNRKIASNYLLYKGSLLRNAIVEIDSTGKIISVGSVESIDSVPYAEFHAGIMIPAMVNAHCHTELSYLRGTITEQCGFASFAEQMRAVRSTFTAEKIASEIARANIDMFNAGISAVGDISNSSDSFAMKRHSPIAYHTFVEHFGLGRNSAEHLYPLLREPHTSLTPHSTYSVQDKVMREIATKGTAPLSIHFMETPSEAELFQGYGSMHEWYEQMHFECDFLQYGSPAERLVASVPASRSVILVHNTAVRERDIDIVMNHFTAPVYWVLCPRSNRYISGAEPPAALLQAKGLNICLGTDSLASNHSLSMVSEMAALNSAPLLARLDWATKIGARALGFEGLGSVEVDTRPGLIVLAGVDVKNEKINDNCVVKRII